MSVWDDFYKLTTLSVVFPDEASAKGASIFGNGRNQVPVLVKVKAVDKNGNALDIEGAWLAAAISLVSYSSGEALSRDGSASTISHWNVLDTASDYTVPYSYNTQTQDSTFSALNDSDVSILKLYVAAADINAVLDIDIAVSLDVPGVGQFNTTADGTDTRNGPGGKSGSVFKSPSYVHVTALRPQDYSNTSLLNLTQTTWDVVGHTNYTVHDWLWDGVYYDKPNGAELFRSAVSVTPKSSEFSFQKVESGFNKVTSANAATGTAVWHHEDEPGIVVNNASGGYDTFVAIGGFGESVGNPNYDAYLWYGPLTSFAQTTGYFHIVDKEWQYRADVTIDDHTTVTPGNTVLFYGFRVRVPTGQNVNHHGWDDTYGPLSFTVTDNFGNQGTFKIGFFGDQSSYLTVGDVHLE